MEGNVGVIHAANKICYHQGFDRAQGLAGSMHEGVGEECAGENHELITPDTPIGHPRKTEQENIEIWVKN